MKKVKYLEVDDDVNVFVVGDIHGEFTQLHTKLKEIGFSVRQDYFSKLLRADIPNFESMVAKMSALNLKFENFMKKTGLTLNIYFLCYVMLLFFSCCRLLQIQHFFHLF